MELRYRGRLDALRTKLVPDARCELFEATRQITESGKGSWGSNRALSCSIKWPIYAVAAADLSMAD
jgi:hypothetical protein